MPAPPSERNLLFAVLALQNELAKPEDVLAAMQAWIAAKLRPLGELLVERGALDVEHRRLLNALIEAQLARHGTAEQSLAALDPSSRARRLLGKVAAGRQSDFGGTRNRVSKRQSMMTSRTLHNLPSLILGTTSSAGCGPNCWRARANRWRNPAKARMPARPCARPSRSARTSRRRRSATFTTSPII